MADEPEVRRARARRLREKIDALKKERAPGPPSSPREFVDQRAREASEAPDEADDEPPPGEQR
jgi:hypothetical protein